MPYAAEFRYTSQVHQMLEGGQAKGQHGDQTLAPRQHLGVLAEVAHQRDRLLQGFRCVILERGGLHFRTKGATGLTR